MTQRHTGQKAARSATPKRARGAVVRADGSIVRRVSAYLEPPLFARLKTHCGDEHTHADVLAEALRRHLDYLGASNGGALPAGRAVGPKARVRS